MRMEPKAVITNPEALEDSDYSDPEAPPVDEIDADEGEVPRSRLFFYRAARTNIVLTVMQTCSMARISMPRYVDVLIYVHDWSRWQAGTDASLHAGN